MLLEAGRVAGSQLMLEGSHVTESRLLLEASCVAVGLLSDEPVVDYVILPIEKQSSVTIRSTYSFTW